MLRLRVSMLTLHLPLSQVVSSRVRALSLAESDARQGSTRVDSFTHLLEVRTLGLLLLMERFVILHSPLFNGKVPIPLPLLAVVAARAER
jgi:hypothetical protein